MLSYNVKKAALEMSTYSMQVLVNVDKGYSLHACCVFIQQPQIVDQYFSESSDNVKLVNVTLRSALHLVRVSTLYDKYNIKSLLMNMKVK